MMEAILTFNKSNSWSRGLPKDSRRSLHGALQALGAISVIIGFSLVVSLHPAEHFTSVHGIFGKSKEKLNEIQI
jgi:hypothetical protein